MPSFKDKVVLLNPVYRDLILYKVYAELRMETERTYMGYLWWIFDPIMEMVVYYIAFGLMLNRNQPGFIWTILVGIVVWRWFEISVKKAASAIRANYSLSRQVYVPKMIFPMVSILGDVFRFMVSWVLLLVVLVLFGHKVSLEWLGLIPLLLSQFLLICALGFLFAAFVPFLPDLVILLDIALRLLFFLSGIFYTGAEIQESHRIWFYLNPMATLIDGQRVIVLNNQSPEWAFVAGTTVASVALLAVSSLLIGRYDQSYPKFS